LRSIDSNGATTLKNDLLIAMAKHLHQLREPAMNHFERLIEFSGNEALIKMLAKEQTESMVKLLLDDTEQQQPDHIPRVQTQDEAYAYHLPDADNTSCFRTNFAAKPNELVKQHFAVSDAFVYRAEERFHIEPQDKKDHPGKVVLRPVNTVLMWFSEFQKSDETALPNSTVRTAQTRALDNEQDLESRSSDSHIPLDAPSLEQMVKDVWASSMGRYMLVGTIFCVFYCLFYLITLRNVFKLLGDGECEFAKIPCIGAAMRKSLGACAMLCYIICMMVVLTKIDKIDNVLIAQKELCEMEDFKHEVDKLNAHAFDSQGGGQRVSLMKELDDHLDKKKELVFEFARDLGSKQLPQYQEFLRAMQSEGPLAKAAAECGSRAERRPLMMGNSKKWTGSQR
jgi:hypothetical protein